jgi:DNA-binding MarR family transcriptional regulator
MGGPEEHTDEIIWALALSHRAMRATVQESLGVRGVHAGQHFVLEALWHEDDLTCGELARRLGVALPTVTKAVTRMESAGFVMRRSNESDARLVHVGLTSRGRALEREVETRLDDVARRALSGITPAERDSLIACLWHIQENLRPGSAEVLPRRSVAADADGAAIAGDDEALDPD